MMKKSAKLEYEKILSSVNEMKAAADEYEKKEIVSLFSIKDELLNEQIQDLINSLK